MIKKAVGIILTLAICAGIVTPASAVKVHTYRYSNIMSLADIANVANSEEDVVATDLTPLDGAVEWAVPELELTLENGLILDDMIGFWAQPTHRLVAAEIIVRLIEIVTSKTFDAIADEKHYDLTDCFIDTENVYANFLKQSGISNGVDGIRFDPNGTFTRAQMVTMLGRMACNLLGDSTEDFPKGSTLFSDVPDWADDFVGWASALGITDGVGGGRFDSDGTLRNQHTGVFIYRAFSSLYTPSHELLRTGEYITAAQMDVVKEEAVSWQSVITGIGEFADIIAVEPSDGLDQQVYIAIRRFDPGIGAHVYDNGFEKLHMQVSGGTQAHILFAVSGAGSGEIIVGFKFATEDSEWIEIFYYPGYMDRGTWDNITVFQQSYIRRLAIELPPENCTFNYPD